MGKKLQEIILARGKKGVDRQEQVDMLTYLASIAKGPVQKVNQSAVLEFDWCPSSTGLRLYTLYPQVEVLVHVASAHFDINPSMSTHMAVPLWKRCTATLLEVLQSSTIADESKMQALRWHILHAGPGAAQGQSTHCHGRGA